MPNRVTQLADQCGRAASFLCVAHCLAIPLILTLLPGLSLGMVTNHHFEQTFISITSALGILTSAIAYQRYQTWRSFGFFVPGLILLWLGLLLDSHLSIGLHGFVMGSGGLLIALGHWTNLRLSKDHCVC